VTNKIYVGRKDIVSYIGAILNNLSEQAGDHEVCHLVARGRDNNAKALDVAEMARRDNEAIVIEEIGLSTEEFLNDDEVAEYVGTIEEDEVADYLESLDDEEYDALVEDVGNKVTSVDITIARNKK